MEKLLLILPEKPQPLMVRYGLSGLIMIASALVQLAVYRYSGFTGLFFLPGIFASGLAFDRGSGFFATLIGSATAAYLFLFDLPQQRHVLLPKPVHNHGANACGCGRGATQRPRTGGHCRENQRLAVSRTQSSHQKRFDGHERAAPLSGKIVEVGRNANSARSRCRSTYGHGERSRPLAQRIGRRSTSPKVERAGANTCGPSRSSSVLLPSSCRPGKRAPWVSSSMNW